MSAIAGSLRGRSCEIVQWVLIEQRAIKQSTKQLAFTTVEFGRIGISAIT
jgi:hypothetical protein